MTNPTEGLWVKPNGPVQKALGSIHSSSKTPPRKLPACEELTGQFPRTVLDIFRFTFETEAQGRRVVMYIFSYQGMSKLTQTQDTWYSIASSCPQSLVADNWSPRARKNDPAFRASI